MANPKDSQLDGLPPWAAVAAKLTAIMVVTGLCIFLVVNLVKNQQQSAETMERLIDKFDGVLVRQDERYREWMLRLGNKIGEENGKTRETLLIANERMLKAIDNLMTTQEKSASDLSKTIEAQTMVLRQIRDEKKMP